MSDEEYDLIIVGGGPGGMTAAIYAGRAELKTLLIEKGSFGGQITDSLDVENFPGSPHLSGQALMDRFKEHVTQSDSVSLLTTRVSGVEAAANHRQIVHTRRRGDYTARAVILDVGAKPRQLGIPGEAEFSGNGVSYCATCDAEFFKNQHVFVLGAGNQAIENAILLTKYASKVSVAVMHDEGILDCNEVDRREAMANNKIEFIWNSTLASINGEDSVTSVTVRNILTGQEHDVDATGVFSFVGMVPQTDFLPDTLVRDVHGYIKVNRNQATNVAGVYAVGDCTDTPLRQVVTASGNGAVAEVNVERYLKETAQLEKIMGDTSGNEAVMFYSPYDDESVKRLEHIEALLTPRYKVNLDDITSQSLLYHQLNIGSDFAVALYQQGHLKQVVDLTQDSAESKLSPVRQ
ncbi:NAD(P)/FAD-dependent oxidoreductase [Furfurilactobacillus rossiae]|uniref:FAD-dependent pyridine nucleotide-disulfide oxidoreductase n=1 Tax=Furfurilactobacillus rossiae DSM 15814 TaxID=1114972 RepID=A0A0R1RQZ8_9LACO|nr:FAD-dependent oxidoreductase [Furfurilactobacillus rossiae]KRL55763.1 FAD-dependent pyridine nucleotide-disulfide oxidoreductase [Furfurilactobacillus rossiae DSM 15814]QFR67286.1 FAD-dependent oxidoreductase [Furfurilactobacillus rossiae]QLE60213.1 Thioredoxin reductase [Furfurilactobacillus rossiae]